LQFFLSVLWSCLVRMPRYFVGAGHSSQIVSPSDLLGANAHN
jgi:hypothetical protein